MSDKSWIFEPREVEIRIPNTGQVLYARELRARDLVEIREMAQSGDEMFYNHIISRSVIDGDELRVLSPEDVPDLPSTVYAACVRACNVVNGMQAIDSEGAAEGGAETEGKS